MKTIASIVTPIGTGGVAIIRLSGADSFKIASKMCEGIENDELEFLKNPRTMQLCRIKAKNFSDQGLAVCFKAPNSFTGEDVVEFQVHGGVLLAEEILNESISLGAVQAGRGEFSKRAFLNGKISLEAAEGIIDLINSESEAELKAGEKLLSGKFYNLIINKQEKIKNILAGLNTLIDYPSEDGIEENEELEKYLKTLKNINLKLTEIYSTYKLGKTIKHGVNVAICGLPNAGKSSVLNAISGTDAAIVSNIPGTTRDVIKETFVYNSIKFNLSDTAGLRKTGDEIEKIGIIRAKEAAKNADIVLYIIDGSVPLGNEDVANLEEFNNYNLVVVINKTDLVTKANFSAVKKYHPFEMSTFNVKDINNLKEILFKKSKMEKLNIDEIVLTNARHYNSLKEAAAFLKEAEEGIDILSLDILSQLIQSAYNKLGEITGEFGSDEVINEIFANFCVGK